eukprot:scaffold649_cov347-Pavlova_lutheri.AAC.104
MDELWTRSHFKQNHLLAQVRNTGEDPSTPQKLALHLQQLSLPIPPLLHARNQLPLPGLGANEPSQQRQIVSSL